MITPLNLPKADIKLKRIDEKVYVWCIVRKKNLLCTPEEWVRQHIVHFLIKFQKIPQGLIASEFNLEYNGRLKRADIVVFNKSRKPIFIVECKAPDVAINENVLHQFAQYNRVLDVPYFMLSNGLDHVYGNIHSEKVVFSQEFPELILD